MLNIENKELVAELNKTIFGYNFKVFRYSYLKGKRKKPTIEERWFCLKELQGKDLPEYIRNNSKGTGYKTFNAFFSCTAFYRMPNSPVSYKQY